MCDWQGMGFGARYEDAGCIEGNASDLDNVVGGDKSGYLIAIGDEDCPQCAGIGKLLGFAEVGVMALYRQRAREDMIEAAGGLPEDEMESFIDEHINPLFKLILTLEGGQPQ